MYLLYDLHWLPIKQKIMYKICIIVYKYVHNSASADIASLLQLASNRNTRPKEKLVMTLFLFMLRNCKALYLVD